MRFKNTRAFLNAESTLVVYEHGMGEMAQQDQTHFTLLYRTTQMPVLSLTHMNAHNPRHTANAHTHTCRHTQACIHHRPSANTLHVQEVGDIPKHTHTHAHTQKVIRTVFKRLF